MAVIKYAGEEAVTKLADYIKERLTVVSAMPSSPSEDQVVLYMGSTTYTYSAVTPEGTEDPSEEGWYELDGTDYTLSTDTTVDNTKTYYEREVEYYQGGIYLYDGAAWELKGVAKTQELTKDEYDALTSAEKNNGTIYFVRDDDSGSGGDAYDIAYDNTDSMLDANNVQDAIDEVVSEKQNNIQYSTMPTASSSNVGSIIQYVGSTTTNYTNGYFYKCVYDSDTSTYSWEAVVGNGNGSVFGYYNTSDGLFYSDSSYTTLIDADDGKTYVDLNTENIYRYDSDNAVYVVIGGGTYEAGFGINITDNVIKTTDFVGTTAEWEALTTDEQAAYDIVNITDDYSATDEGSPGHAIMDEDGTEMTQRSYLQFSGLEVTDDSTNDITVVTAIPYTAGDGIDITEQVVSVTDEVAFTFTGTTAEWEALSDDEKAVYTIVNLTDDTASGELVVVDAVEEGNLNPITSNAVYEAVSANYVYVTGDGSKSYSTLLDELYDLIDTTSVGLTPHIVVDNSVFYRIGDSQYSACALPSSASISIEQITISSSGSTFEQIVNDGSSNTYTDLSSTIVTSGVDIYYVYN